ncbi:hypothetical protein STANM309S_06265 [Streptomyces tanashiensis]
MINPPGNQAAWTRVPARATSAPRTARAEWAAIRAGFGRAAKPMGAGSLGGAFRGAARGEESAPGRGPAFLGGVAHARASFPAPGGARERDTGEQVGSRAPVRPLRERRGTSW